MRQPTMSYSAARSNSMHMALAPPFASANQFPPFQPAPSPEGSFQASDFQKPAQEPAVIGESAQEGKLYSLSQHLANHGPLYLLAGVGTCFLSLLILAPIWNMCKLLWSSTYVYFLGRGDCFWVITCCVLTSLAFIVVMLLLAKCGRREVNTLHTSVLLFTATISAMGLGLLLLSVSMRAKTNATWDALIMNPSTSRSTAPLVAYYHVLLEERLKPDCLNKTSIEQCPGYEARDPYTGFLKHLELKLECSGFGYVANSTKPKKATKLVQLPQEGRVSAMHDEVGLIQASGFSVVHQVSAAETAKQELAAALKRRAAKRRKQLGLHQDTAAPWMALLAINYTIFRRSSSPPWDHLPRGVGDTADNMEATGWMQKYPPTLFTKANYKTTCEGAAAREIRYKALRIADELRFTAIMMLMTAMGVGFLRLLSMCVANEAAFFESQSSPKSLSGESRYQTYKQ